MVAPIAPPVPRPLYLSLRLAPAHNNTWPPCDCNDSHTYTPPTHDRVSGTPDSDRREREREKVIMSASGVLFQLGVRRGRPSSSVSRSMLRYRRSQLSTTTTQSVYPTATVSQGLRHGLSRFGRARSSIPLPRLGTSPRSFSGTALLSSSEGSTGPRPMKVAIIGQSLFGREVY